MCWSYCFISQIYGTSTKIFYFSKPVLERHIRFVKFGVPIITTTFTGLLNIGNTHLHVYITMAVMPGF